MKDPFFEDDILIWFKLLCSNLDPFDSSLPGLVSFYSCYDASRASVGSSTGHKKGGGGKES